MDLGLRVSTLVGLFSCFYYLLQVHGGQRLKVFVWNKLYWVVDVAAHWWFEDFERHLFFFVYRHFIEYIAS